MPASFLQHPTWSSVCAVKIREGFGNVDVRVYVAFGVSKNDNNFFFKALSLRTLSTVWYEKECRS